MQIGKTFTFDAAHRLQNHGGKCRNLHGHTYHVEVTLKGEALQQEGPAQGMLMDFDRLKAWWKAIEPSLDHTVLLESTDPLVGALHSLGRDGTSITLFMFPPTAENLAIWVVTNLRVWLQAGSRDLDEFGASVRIYETPTSWAEVMG